MASVDVTVRGAGVFGLSVAYACARRGARVRVIDPGGPGAGASGGIVGALSPHTPENWNEKKAFQFDSLDGAAGFWAGVEQISGLPSGYGRVGRVQPLSDARALELARTREESALKLWQGRYRWQVVEAGTHPHYSAPATGRFVLDTLSARLHPKKAVSALAAAIEALGGDIAQAGAAEGAEVVATGVAGLRDLTSESGRMAGTGVKGQAALFALDLGDAPTLYADGIYIVPHADRTVAVGSTSERDYESPDTTDDRLEELLARAVAICPALKDAPRLASWAGERPRARSRAPMLGQWPGKRGVYIANGGFKIGFGMAPKVGEVMADLVLEGRDTIPESFRVEASL